MELSEGRLTSLLPTRPAQKRGRSDCFLPPQPFDFINARTIAQSVNDWPRLLQQAMQHLNPGGYIEIGEYGVRWKCDDGSMPADWPPYVLLNLVQQGAERIGRQFPDGEFLRNLLEAAGFEDVTVKHLKLPAGKWPKNLQLKNAGIMALLAAESGYEAYGFQLLTRVLGMPDHEVAELCKKARLAHYQPGANKVHAYMD